mmetsp:Transcript_45314/g.96392  ORF Transcript_45314/g.96392 Transcript_45314/m.96392 type:complete len:280 (-) Transcript_45314:122-961(-)
MLSRRPRRDAGRQRSTPDRARCGTRNAPPLQSRHLLGALLCPRSRRAQRRLDLLALRIANVIHRKTQSDGCAVHVRSWRLASAPVLAWHGGARAHALSCLRRAVDPRQLGLVVCAQCGRDPLLQDELLNRQLGPMHIVSAKRRQDRRPPLPWPKLLHRPALSASRLAGILLGVAQGFGGANPRRLRLLRACLPFSLHWSDRLGQVSAWRLPRSGAAAVVGIGGRTGGPAHARFELPAAMDGRRRGVRGWRRVPRQAGAGLVPSASGSRRSAQSYARAGA